MRKVKKTKVAVILISVLVCLGVIVGCVVPKLIYLYMFQWSYIVDDFDVYEEDFELIVEFAEEVFTSEEKSTDNNSSWISVGAGYTLYFEGEYLDMPQEVQDSLKRIDTEAFDYKGSNFHILRYYDGRIAFETTNGAYALVYSFDDERPTFVNSPDEDGTCLVRKIKDHWYHVVEKSE